MKSKKPMYGEVQHGKETGYGYEKVVYDNGGIDWYVDGTLENDFGPAEIIVEEDGTIEKHWYHSCYGEMEAPDFRGYPWLIEQMQAAELFEPEELMTLKHIKKCSAIFKSNGYFHYKGDRCDRIGQHNINGKHYCGYHKPRQLT